jgi:pimeloyl-ACP methyl ester carboxylesterase
MTTTTTADLARRQTLVHKIYQAFFTPPRYEVKHADRDLLDRGLAYRLPFAGGELAVTTWGTPGPAVLLLHGWGGARAQMTGLVEPLLSAGFRVVAYDQPAHGESDGQTTNLLEIAPTLDLIAAREGPFHALLAHSFGALIASYTLAERGLPQPARLVYFGALNRLMDSLPRFQRQAKLPDDLLAGLRDLLYARFTPAVLDAIVNARLAPRLALPALMFHDLGDDVTPIDDSRAIAQAWPSARLVETAGLGHRGALRSPAIHAQVVQFLTA